MDANCMFGIEYRKLVLGKLTLKPATRMPARGTKYLSSSVDDLTVVFHRVVRDRLREGVLDGRIVCIDEVVLCELNHKGRLSWTGINKATVLAEKAAHRQNEHPVPQSCVS